MRREREAWSSWRIDRVETFEIYVVVVNPILLLFSSIDVGGSESEWRKLHFAFIASTTDTATTSSASDQRSSAVRNDLQVRHIRTLSPNITNTADVYQFVRAIIRFRWFYGEKILYSKSWIETHHHQQSPSSSSRKSNLQQIGIGQRHHHEPGSST